MKTKMKVSGRMNIGKGLVEKNPTYAYASAAVNSYDGKNDKGEPKFLTSWYGLIWLGEKSVEHAKKLKLVAGMMVEVEGDQRVRKYTDKDGVERQAVEIIVRECEIVPKEEKKDGAGSTDFDPNDYLN